MTHIQQKKYLINLVGLLPDGSRPYIPIGDLQIKNTANVSHLKIKKIDG